MVHLLELSPGGVLFLRAAVGQVKSGKFPVFFALMALLCLFIAGEEISWGQRLLGYRAPVYFLERNFQQELKIHNVVSTGWRKLTLLGIVFGYGIALPLLFRMPRIREWMSRLTVVPPPPHLILSFAVMLPVHRMYAWQYTGEIVETMLGLAFLSAALEAALSGGTSSPTWP